MLFQIKRWFYKKKLELSEKRNARLNKKYAEAKELDALMKETNKINSEAEKKQILINKHSWSKKTTDAIQTFQKHLPKVEPISRESTKQKKPKSSSFDLGKDFFDIKIE